MVVLNGLLSRKKASISSYNLITTHAGNRARLLALVYTHECVFMVTLCAYRKLHVAFNMLAVVIDSVSIHVMYIIMQQQ